MLKKGIYSNKIPPGFVEGCGGNISTCDNLAGNCSQSVEFCLDSSGAVPGSILRFRVNSNANWCSMPYYNCRNGVQNSYCGPMIFEYEVPDPMVWEGAGLSDEVYRMIMNDYRMGGYFQMDIVDGCLVITSREAYTKFEIVIDEATGFVPVVTELIPASLADQIPYGYVVVSADQECFEGMCVSKLPDADNTNVLGIAARCHEKFQSCGDHVVSSAVAKVTERFFYLPGEKVHILTSGEIWVPVAQKPTSLSNRLVFDNTGVNGLIVPIPYSDPTPTGMIDLDGSPILFNEISQLLLINFNNAN